MTPAPAGPSTERNGLGKNKNNSTRRGKLDFPTKGWQLEDAVRYGRRFKKGYKSMKQTRAFSYQRDKAYFKHQK